MSTVEITSFIIFTTQDLSLMLVSNFALGNPSKWKLSLVSTSLVEGRFLQLVTACSVCLYKTVKAHSAFHVALPMFVELQSPAQEGSEYLLTQ